MARAKFSYVPNIPTPGELQLAGAGPNDPVAGIHLLNAQMERRRGLDEHNATMEQIMQAQSAQAAEAGKVELLKAMANASNPMFQAEAARLGGAPADDITRIQQMEMQAALAENMQKAGAGFESFSDAGVQGTDPLAAFGLPDNMKVGMRPDIQREQMGNQTTLEAARIGASATRDAARARGGGGGTKPKVTLSPYVPGLGPLQMQGGNIADVLGMNNQLQQLLGRDSGGMPVESEELKVVMPQLEAAAAQSGMTVPPGSTPKKAMRGGRQVIILPTLNQDGTPGEIVGEL
jgi:hypothetical protein